MILAKGVGLREVRKVHQDRAVRVSRQFDWIPHNSSLQPKVFLDPVLEPLADFLPATMHRQDRHLVAQPDNEMTTLAGIESAALL